MSTGHEEPWLTLSEAVAMLSVSIGIQHKCDSPREAADQARIGPRMPVLSSLGDRSGACASVRAGRRQH